VYVVYVVSVVYVVYVVCGVCSVCVCCMWCNFNNILEHDLFLYRLSHRRKPQLPLFPGETLHRERSGVTATCGCLFGFVYKKKPTYLEPGEIYQRRELSARAAFFCGWWEYKLDLRLD
jgi:hypothetical protein